MVLSEGTTEKIPSDTTGNRSGDRPTSSATTTLPQAPLIRTTVHYTYASWWPMWF